MGQLLDEKFHIAYNLTYNTMAMHKDVDTSMLRRAIWNYIHCMFGIRSVLFLRFIDIRFATIGFIFFDWSRTLIKQICAWLVVFLGFCFLLKQRIVVQIKQ